jgi:hypothetical protein
LPVLAVFLVFVSLSTACSLVLDNHHGIENKDSGHFISDFKNVGWISAASSGSEAVVRLQTPDDADDAACWF